MNSTNLQIQALSKQGYTAEQISMGLTLNLDAVKVVLAGIEGGKKEAKTLEERFGDVEELAVDCLKDIVLSGQNESAKVMASKLLLEMKESINNKMGFDYDKVAERLEKSRKVSEVEEESNVVAMEG